VRGSRTPSKSDRSRHAAAHANAARARAQEESEFDTSESRRLSTWVAAAVLALAALACYANALHLPFVYDDVSGIVENSHIRQLRPLTTVLTAPPQNPVGGRPVVGVTLALNYALGGVDPWGYHVVNLVILWGTAVLLFAIVRLTLLTSPAVAALRPLSASASLAIAVIWLMHPLQSEVVDYAVQRTESLMGLFLLLTLYAAMRHMRGSGSSAWSVLAVVACAIGMGTKESMVTAPLLVLLYDAVFVSGSLRNAVRRRWPLYVGLSACWMLLAGLVAGGPRSATAGFSAGLSPATYLLDQGPMIVTYLKRALWPTPLLIDYGPAQAVSFAQVWPSVAMVGALALGSLVLVVTRPAVGFLAAWFFITLAPSSSIVPIASEVGAERRMYLPLMALVALVVMGALALLERRGRLVSRHGDRRVVDHWLIGLSATVCLVCGTVTVARNHEYVDQVSLWRGVVAVRPHGRAFVSLGAALQRRGDISEAVAQYQRGAALGRYEAHYALGLVFESMNNAAAASDAYRHFIAQSGRDYRVPDAHVRLGRSLMRLGSNDEAEASFRNVFVMEPTNTDARRGLADALLAQGKFENAAQEYRAYLARVPTDAAAHGAFGRALVGMDRTDSAVVEFQTAVMLAPSSPGARMNAGLALASVGRLEEAEKELRAGVALAPSHAPLLSALGNVLAAEGRAHEASQAFDRALALDPMNPLVRADIDAADTQARRAPRAR
jgi:tetratricopeptide (TPR) repeat protein